MSEFGIRILAQIRLLPSSMSGRTVPIQGSYRPNHNFGGPDDREMTIGFIDFPAGKQLFPGEEAEIEMTFWDRPSLAKDIKLGREWRIQEGAKLIGFGTVLKVMD